MQVNECAVCGESTFSKLWELPQLPFTEKFGSFDPGKHPPVDQMLLACKTCGHVQLGFQVSPSTLYQPSEYAFRTSASASAIRGSQLFLEFFHEIAKDRFFTSLLDIGGNDLYLARQLDLSSKSVIDPVCTEKDEAIVTLSAMIEDVDLAHDITQPDLVFCRHVLEHISSPRQLLAQLFSQCHENALYIFEIPAFDCLVEAGRFDAIFHQHYHYFDLDSFKQLISRNGGRYLGHRYNYGGSCGGALIIAFEKGNTPVPSPLNKNIERPLAAFIEEMDALAVHMNSFPGPLYGYGASLMLATFAYHLKSDLSFLEAVLDDDPEKNGWGYQNLPVRVAHPDSLSINEDAGFVVTSLENVRPILQKLIAIKPRRIFVPSTV